MLANHLTGLGQALLHSADSQFAVFYSQNQGVASLDPQRPTKRCGNNKPPIFVDPRTALLTHDNFHNMSY